MQWFPELRVRTPTKGHKTIEYYCSVGEILKYFIKWWQTSQPVTLSYGSCDLIQLQPNVLLFQIKATARRWLA